jgi:hypothetical protein
VAELQIPKLDAARRQVETAIRLYFCEGDPVAIHTLTAAGHQLLFDLNKARGGPAQWPKWMKSEYRNEFIRKLSEAGDFFTDRDPDKTLQFDPAQSELLLIDCCEKYRELGGERVPLLAIYQLWSWLTWARPYMQDDAFANVAARFEKYLVTVGGNGQRQSFFAAVLPLAYEAGLVMKL